MKESARDWLIVLLVMAALGLGLLLGGGVWERYWYKEGQIDAINGIIKYELQEQDNGEMRWERIEGE